LNKKYKKYKKEESEILLERIKVPRKEWKRKKEKKLR
jgi:hypothetical protein